MKKSKKLMAMLMTATLVIGSLTACGKAETSTTAPKEETATKSEEPTDKNTGGGIL